MKASKCQFRFVGDECLERTSRRDWIESNSLRIDSVTNKSNLDFFYWPFYRNDIVFDEIIDVLGYLEYMFIRNGNERGLGKGGKHTHEHTKWKTVPWKSYKRMDESINPKASFNPELPITISRGGGARSQFNNSLVFYRTYHNSFSSNWHYTFASILRLSIPGFKRNKRLKIHKHEFKSISLCAFHELTDHRWCHELITIIIK